MKFPYGVIHMPALLEEKKRVEALVYVDEDGKIHRPIFNHPRVSWHGKRCEVLGRWPKYNYAAIRFPECGPQEYEIVRNEEVI